MKKQRKYLLILDLVGVVLQVDRSYHLPKKYAQLDRLIGQYPLETHLFAQYKHELGLRDDELKTAEEEIGRAIVGNESEIQKLMRLQDVYQIAIYNNGGKLAPDLPYDTLQAWIRDYRLNDLTPHIYNSAQIGFAKPDRQGFDYIAQQLGYTLHDIVFVDDSIDICTEVRTFLNKVIVFRPYDAHYTHTYDTLVAELLQYAENSAMSASMQDIKI